MKERTVNRITTALITSTLILIVTAVTTLIYWAAGGEFKRSSELAIYAMVTAYWWALVFKVSMAKHAEAVAEEEQRCKFCGTKVTN